MSFSSPFLWPFWTLFCSKNTGQHWPVSLKLSICRRVATAAHPSWKFRDVEVQIQTPDFRKTLATFTSRTVWSMLRVATVRMLALLIPSPSAFCSHHPDVQPSALSWADCSSCLGLPGREWSSVQVPWQGLRELCSGPSFDWDRSPLKSMRLFLLM